MIAPIHSPVSSVVRIAEEACREEGVTLGLLIQARAYGQKRRPYWVGIRQRVVFRMRQDRVTGRGPGRSVDASGARPPSFPEIARALGMPNHSSAITACRREERRREKAE